MIFIPGVQKIWTRHENHGSNIQTPLVTLTLNRPGWNMGSVRRLDGLNISLKFHDIHSRRSEDMNQTQNTFKYSNTTGDLDLEPARLEHGFCTSSWLGEHLTKVSWNSLQGLKSCGPDTKCARKHGQTDEDHSYIPRPATRREIIKCNTSLDPSDICMEYLTWA
jgi:hypothetical protein